jgi:DNA-binding NarL/FixJ family response regulator
MAHPSFIVADDHPLFRAALCQALTLSYPKAQVYEASDMSSLQQVTEDNPKVDLLLLDLHMPGAHGFSGLVFINGHYPELPIMVVSANEKPEVMRRAIDYGAAGFLPKSSSPETISQAVNEVLKGEHWLPADVSPLSSDDKPSPLNNAAEVIATLTPQQFRVSTMLAAGMLNKQIAYEMNITEATVKAHLTAIFKKLGVNNRTQAVLTISSLDVEPPGKITD